MDKGIFWVRKNPYGKIDLITVKVPCDINGTALCPVCYTAKSGNNFNHKAEWEKLDRCVTFGQRYNYYPRGRVEIKKGKVTVYANSALLRKDILSLIIEEFDLSNVELSKTVRFKADNSTHYRFLTQEEF